MRRTRVLIDGMNMAHRLRHAMRDLADNKGNSTGVLYGTLKLLDRVGEDFKPDEIIVVWEYSTHKSWRYQAYPDYKKARRERYATATDVEHEDMTQFSTTQIPDTVTALAKIGITQIAVPHLEADDVLGLIARARKWDKSQYVIVSSDRDMLQLVRRYRCRVYSPTMEAVYYQNESGELCSTRDKQPLAPSPLTYLLWRTIIGDTSDSIEGIPGVGEKSVHQMLTQRWDGNSNALEEYLAACPLNGARGRHILSGIETIKRNLNLMRLGTGVASKLSALPPGTKEFIRFCLKDLKKSTHEAIKGIVSMNGYPPFLKGTDINSSLRTVKFFASKQFEFVFDEPRLEQWLRRYRKLYRLSKEIRHSKEYWNAPDTYLLTEAQATALLQSHAKVGLPNSTENERGCL